MTISNKQREERALAKGPHDRAMAILNATKVIQKEAAEGRLRQTFNDRATISFAFNRRFEVNLPPSDALSVIRYSREIIEVESTTPGEPIRFPTIGSNEFIPGGPRCKSAEGTELSRTSRAANIAKHVMTGGGRAIVLEGTSANHPEMNAAENMASLAACIRAAICDIDRKYPDSIKSCVAVVELSSGVRQNRADAHGALVIHGDDQLLSIAEDFQSFLIQRGAMNRALHETDGMRVVIVCGIDRFQRFYQWILYCIKASQQTPLFGKRGMAADMRASLNQRRETALQDSSINIVGNRLDNLFILHKKRAVTHQVSESLIDLSELVDTDNEKKISARRVSESPIKHEELVDTDDEDGLKKPVRKFRRLAFGIKTATRRL